MIEPAMYFGIGFLVAALVGLVILPLVHNRAVRLTVRRLEAATPLSMAEIQADKDQLRAEFAMSTRRLEMTVEQLKAKSTSQLAELGKKNDAINRLKMELGEKTATIFALEARDKALHDQLRATEDELAAKTAAMLEAQRAVSEKEAELARLINALGERSRLADARDVELGTMKGQIEALKERLTSAGNELQLLEHRRELERIELKRATQELSEERAKTETLGRRVAELEQSLAAQTTAAEVLGRRAQELENRLSEQSRLLNESEFELKRLRGELDDVRKVESDLRAAFAELEDRSSFASQKLKAENARLEADLAHTKDDRDRIASELAALKREAEENWENERVENALLRERISDVAAEVARLASSLEGPNSSIEAILAAEAARDRASATTAVTAHREAELSPEVSSSGTLADRIRALQRQSSPATSDKPQRRN